MIVHCVWRALSSRKHLAAAVTAALVLGGPATMAQASGGNDFVALELGVNQSYVYNADDYTTLLYANALPTSNYPDFTTGWLGLTLHQPQYDQYGNEIAYSEHFIQVGLKTTAQGVQWFVYAEPGLLSCRAGATYIFPISGTSPTMYRECDGPVGDFAALGGWQKMEMVHYSGQSWWVARVYNSSGSPTDVAQINDSGPRIYRAMDYGEEGYVETSDPHLPMAFYHYQPQYMSSTGFQNWPSYTQVGGNHLFTSPSGICPTYYGANVYQYSPPYWLSTNYGNVCDINPMF